MEPVWQNQGAADIAVSIFQLSTIPRIPSFLLNAPVCNHHHHHHHHHHRNRSQNHMMPKLDIVDMPEGIKLLWQWHLEWC